MELGAFSISMCEQVGRDGEIGCGRSLLATGYAQRIVACRSRSLVRSFAPYAAHVFRMTRQP